MAKTKKNAKNKQENTAQQAFGLFISSFLIMLIVFTAIAKYFSPDVDNDIDISAADYNIENQSPGREKGFIDERLKFIKIDDETPEPEISEEELDEVVVLPDSVSKKTSFADRIIHLAPTAPKLSTPLTETKEADVRPSKVYVGYYHTKDQALIAKEILEDNELNLQPFIKDMGGIYTLQVGSYQDRDIAEKMVQELLKNNIPARIVQ